MNKFIFIITLSLLFFSVIGQASELQMGLSVGPAFVRNADFNGSNTDTDTHLVVGLNLDYPIQCASGFCDGLFVEPGFILSFAGESQFGSTRVASTGVTGNYSESVTIYSGNVNFKKYFRLHPKLSAFVLSGLGASYFKLSNVHFTDALGQELALNISQSSLNMNFNIGAGIAYEVGNKVLIDIKMEPHLVFPSISDQSFLTVPIGLHYAF